MDSIDAIIGRKPITTRDPREWCRAVLSSRPYPSVHDILLTSHARLIKLAADWLSIHQIHPGSNHYDSVTNGALDAWKRDFDDQPIDRSSYTRQLELSWLFIKAMVNAASTNTEPGRWSESKGAAMTFLQVCGGWAPREELANLPNCYFQVSASKRGKLGTTFRRFRFVLIFTDDERRRSDREGRDRGGGGDGSTRCYPGLSARW